MHESSASVPLSQRGERTRPCRPSRWRGPLALALAAVLSACSGLTPFPQDIPPASQGTWLELNGPASAKVAPGVTLELPMAPYRPRFADAKGIYYQATQALAYRTDQGIVSVVDGGLYVAHADPGHAVAWHEPLWGAATMPYANRWSVKLWRPSSP